MTRVKETIVRHDKGYNCAQSVACTYADLVGLDEATMFKVTEGLGKGMGGTLATCGALSGACVLAGMKRSTGNLETPDSKLETYKLAEEIVNRFQEQCHSLVCKELKGFNSLSGLHYERSPYCGRGVGFKGISFYPEDRELQADFVAECYKKERFSIKK